MLATKDGRFSRVAVFCDRRDKKDDGGGPSAQGVKEEIERLAKGDRKAGRAETKNSSGRTACRCTTCA